MIKKNKKKIYVAGAGGMLGDAIYKVFKKNYQLKCTDIDVNESWLSYLDFRDYNSYLTEVFKFKPDYLFHIGAFTDLEYCENNIKNTYLTNTLSVENAVLIAKKLNIPIIYISTAGIFDGKKKIYDDWDLPNPLGHYARSKYAGEIYVERNSNKYLICRAGWMMGGGPKKDKKFINKIIKQIIKGKKILHIVNDKFGTPTYTIDFANNLKLLLEKEIWGLYNMVCHGTTSRLEVTEELLKILNLKKKIKIKKVKSHFLKKEYYAKRPNSEQLINKKLHLRNLDIMRDWKICLNEYLKKDFARIFRLNHN